MKTEDESAAFRVPELIDFARLSASVHEPYHNRSLSRVNDHEVRMSVVTGPFRWHRHPDSDETFLVIEGGLEIEFEGGEVLLRRGQMLTVRAASAIALGPKALAPSI